GAGIGRRGGRGSGKRRGGPTLVSSPAARPGTSSAVPALPRSPGPRKSNGHERSRIAEKQVSFSADRRANQGAGRLAGRDARPPPPIYQAGRPRGGRGGEGGRGVGGGSRRSDLHGQDVQERREDDLRQGGGARGPIRPLQLQPRGQHQARH